MNIIYCNIITLDKTVLLDSIKLGCFDFIYGWKSILIDRARSE